MDEYIALDIGGTNIRAAVYSGESIEYCEYIKIRTDQNDHSAIENIICLIKEIWPGSGNIRGITCAAPGSIDIKSGIVILAPNIPGWENIALREILTEEFSTNVFVNNDARLAALGEWKHGAGKGHDNFLYFTISTGIGGGAIVNGEPLEGSLGIATELGHMQIVDNGPVCGCGQRGHLEALSSGTAIENFVLEEIRNGAKTDLIGSPTTKTIAEAVTLGDELALAAFQRAGYFLGIGVANYLHIFNPSCIVFGGGVSQTGDIIFEPFRKSLKAHVLNSRYLDNLEIKPASLGDNAGLVGAIVYLRQNT